MNNSNEKYFNEITHKINIINNEINKFKKNTKDIRGEIFNFNVSSNINYINSMLNTIQNEMSKIIIKNNNNDNIDENVNYLSFLFNHINKIISVYNIEHENYDLVNMRLKKENFEHFIPQKDQVIEKFDLSFITKLFDDLMSPINSIKGFFEDFITWLKGDFLDMIKLFIKILTFLVNFLIKIVPKLLKELYLFLIKLTIKLLKVGIITILFGALLYYVLTLYWKYILNENSVENLPITLTALPTVLITWNIFWKHTYIFEYFQIKIIKYFIKLLTGGSKLIFITLLGLPENDPFFVTAKKSKDFLELSGLFFNMIYTNFDTMIIRLLIILAIAKTIFIKYIDIIKAVVITPKELLLYMNIVVHKILNFGSSKN